MDISSKLPPRAIRIARGLRTPRSLIDLGIAMAAVVTILSGCSKQHESIRTEPVIPIPPPEPTAIGVASSSTPVLPAPPLSASTLSAKRIRDTATLMVDGVVETWRFEWNQPPRLACVDATWWTCPCTGFAFGEEGDIELVRERAGGAEIERFNLAGALVESGEGSTAIVQGWEPTKEDHERSAFTDAGPPPTRSELEARPRVRVLVFGDYDHDGAATEFVFQIATQPCFRTYSVVIGISRTNRRLHVFRDAKAPSSPIVLSYKQDWERVRTKLPTRLVEIGCGDHGSQEEVAAVVTADGRGLHLTKQTKSCR